MSGVEIAEMTHPLVLAALIAVPCHAIAAPAGDANTPASATAIRPFRVNVPQAALDDLRRRVLATRWPDKETVPDRSQGTQLAKLQELVRYWPRWPYTS